MATISKALADALASSPAQRIIIETDYGADGGIVSELAGMSPVTQRVALPYFGLSFVSAFGNKSLVEAIADMPGVRHISLDKDVRILSPFLAFDGPLMKRASPLMSRAKNRAGMAQDRVRELAPPPILPTKKIVGDGVVTTSMVKERLGGYRAAEAGIDGSGVAVGIIDTGIGVNRQTKVGQVKTFSAKFDEGGDQDRSGHGTHCLTTVGGSRVDVTPKGYESRPIIIEGIAPGVKLISARALFTPLGTGSNSDVLKAMALALEAGADVISMSLGSDTPGEPEDPDRRLIEAIARNTNTVVVVAAGNAGLKGPKTVGSPGDTEEALTVGSISYFDGKRSFYSSYGPTSDGRQKPDCCGLGGGRTIQNTEPEENILSSSAGMIDDMDGGFRLAAISGSSMATPQVAAIVALWKQYWKNKTGEALNTEAVKRIIAKHGTTKNNETGWGLLSYDWVTLEA